MIGFNVRLDENDVARAKRMLRAVPNGFPRAASRAINKTATRARTLVIGGIRAERPGLPVKSLRKAVTLRRASFGKLSAWITISTRRVPLIEMAPNPKTPERDLGRSRRRGVSVKAAKGGRVRLRHAFIARMPSGRVGVFSRRNAQFGRYGAARLPIFELRGPSAAVVLDEAGNLEAEVERQTEANLTADLGTQVDLLLRRASK